MRARATRAAIDERLVFPERLLAADAALLGSHMLAHGIL
jgi:hypothetical protein